MNIYFVYVTPIDPEYDTEFGTWSKARLGYVATSLDGAKEYVRTTLETERQTRMEYNTTIGSGYPNKPVTVPKEYNPAEWHPSEDGMTLDYGPYPNFSIVEYPVDTALLDERRQFKPRYWLDRAEPEPRPVSTDDLVEELEGVAYDIAELIRKLTDKG